MRDCSVLHAEQFVTPSLPPVPRPRAPAPLCVLSPHRARALDQTTGGADLGDTHARAAQL